MKPEVSIVIPVYNSERYLKECIQSILDQSFRNWELLVVDGNSTDNTKKIVLSYKDKRIHYISSTKHLNILEATQKGASRSKGMYLAFLDSDNVMHKDRLLIQYLFLKKNPRIVLAGTWYRQIDSRGKNSHRFYKPFLKDTEIKAKMLFGNCIVQPTVMVQKGIFQNYGYRDKYHEAADYDLWMRISNQHIVANIPLVLTYYRVHGDNVSGRKQVRRNMDTANMQILREQFTRIKLSYSNKELLFHIGLEKKESISINELNQYRVWLTKLKNFNTSKKIHNQNFFNYLIYCYWFRVCSISAKNGRAVVEEYKKSELNLGGSRELLLLIILCLFKIDYPFETYSYSWRQIMRSRSLLSYLRFYFFSLPTFIVGITIRKLLLK